MVLVLVVLRVVLSSWEDSEVLFPMLRLARQQVAAWALEHSVVLVAVPTRRTPVLSPGLVAALPALWRPGLFAAVPLQPVLQTVLAVSVDPDAHARQG